METIPFGVPGKQIPNRVSAFLILSERDSKQIVWGTQRKVFPDVCRCDRINIKQEGVP